MKIQPTEWQKIFANKTNIYKAIFENKRLISKIYKRLMHLYIKKKTIEKKGRSNKAKGQIALDSENFSLIVFRAWILVWISVKSPCVNSLYDFFLRIWSLKIFPGDWKGKKERREGRRKKGEKNGQKTQIGISPKKSYRRSAGT